MTKYDFIRFKCSFQYTINFELNSKIWKGRNPHSTYRTKQTKKYTYNVGNTINKRDYCSRIHYVNNYRLKVPIRYLKFYISFILQLKGNFSFYVLHMNVILTWVLLEIIFTTGRTGNFCCKITFWVQVIMTDLILKGQFENVRFQKVENTFSEVASFN